MQLFPLIHVAATTSIPSSMIAGTNPDITRGTLQSAQRIASSSRVSGMPGLHSRSSLRCHFEIPPLRQLVAPYRPSAPFDCPSCSSSYSPPRTFHLSQCGSLGGVFGLQAKGFEMPFKGRAKPQGKRRMGGSAVAPPIVAPSTVAPSIN